jgi:2-polyprenyl-6-methoxyphenol hydroxylase-like FAD-dependent oxidoreductase
MSDVDVAIVGGGIGGSALGGLLARAGLRVLIVERERSFTDRVRGEWMAPWGVAELRRLGLYERFIAAGGHHLSRHIGYDELVPAAEASSRPLPIAELLPGIPGPLCLEHVVMQNEALAQATESGAHLRRGVTDVRVTAGRQPSIAFVEGGATESVSARLVIGADGRTSTVRRQLGLTLEEAPIDHLIAGLLIDGAEGWPQDLQAGGKVGGIHYLIFPQGRGRARLYADFAANDRGRFAGPGGAERMLAAFAMPCVPHSEAIATARPIGPCRSYPSQDAWLDEPFVDGVVLIGDAAGYNDPIIGQGVSITLRDARIVGEILIGSDAWDVSSFEPYATERRERLRRLRASAVFDTSLNARFEPRDLERRSRAIVRIAADPSLLMPMLAIYTGPETVDAGFFTHAFHERAEYRCTAPERSFRWSSAGPMTILRFAPSFAHGSTWSCRPIGTRSRRGDPAPTSRSRSRDASVRHLPRAAG